jgi:type VI secretion system secreted protein VgrG
VEGSQTALVVGPLDEEIYTDKFGRVKVQFHWDREGRYDENSSCWTRVSQGWAGGAYGMMFLPRVGHEVIVDFIEGDPDRPIVTGRVYNADLTVPYDLPEHKTRSVIKSQSSKGGEGCNAIVIEDLKDKEVLHFSAQRDMDICVNNDLAERVDNNRHLTVGKDRRELIKQHKYGEVRLDFHEKIGGNKSLTVGGSVGEQFGGAHSESCGSYYLKSKGDIVVESDAGITLKVGGNFVKVHGGGVDIMGSAVKINSGGSAGSGSGAPLGKVPEPQLYYNAKPGYDKSYNQNAEPPAGEAAAAGAGEAPAEPEEEKKTSWIEIELVDEAGQPWPNERYEITGPNGKVYRGTLDENGQAHVEVELQGEHQISFPKLDQDAWERS